ncbi:MAG: AhpC/TSA family protein [Phycisphaerales bacterium]|nr:AhpC/TSA family protein [Phycisphaerales bacterium]
MQISKALCVLAALGSIISLSAVAGSTEPTTSSSLGGESAIRDTPYQVGEKMPNITLPAIGKDGKETEASLESMLADGPVVLTFFRGSWCPYCVTELKAVEKRIKKIEALGASVLAISPEQPAETVKLDKKLKLDFVLATDHNNVVARQLGLLFQMPDEMIEKYKEYKIDVPQSNGTETWQLPIPATYVIDTDRTIRFAFVDVDYSKRANYDDVLEILEEIKNDG